MEALPLKIRAAGIFPLSAFVPISFTFRRRPPLRRRRLLVDIPAKTPHCLGRKPGLAERNRGRQSDGRGRPHPLAVSACPAKLDTRRRRRRSYVRGFAAASSRPSSVVRSSLARVVGSFLPSWSDSVLSRVLSLSYFTSCEPKQKER